MSVLSLLHNACSLFLAVWIKKLPAGVRPKAYMPALQQAIKYTGCSAITGPPASETGLPCRAWPAHASSATHTPRPIWTQKALTASATARACGTAGTWPATLRAGAWIHDAAQIARRTDVPSTPASATPLRRGLKRVSGDRRRIGDGHCRRRERCRRRDGLRRGRRRERRGPRGSHRDRRLVGERPKARRAGICRARRRHGHRGQINHCGAVGGNVAAGQAGRRRAGLRGGVPGQRALLQGPGLGGHIGGGSCRRRRIRRCRRIRRRRRVRLQAGAHQHGKRNDRHAPVSRARRGRRRACGLGAARSAALWESVSPSAGRRGHDRPDPAHAVRACMMKPARLDAVHGRDQAPPTLSAPQLRPAPKACMQRDELGSAAALTGTTPDIKTSVAGPRTQQRVRTAPARAAHRLAARHGRAARDAERRARGRRDDAQERGVAQADLQAVGWVGRRRQRPLPQQRALQEQEQVRVRACGIGLPRRGGCLGALSAHGDGRCRAWNGS